MEALSEYTDYLTYLPLVIIIFVLIKTWHNIGSRWFLTLLLTVECIDSYSFQYSMQWTTHYYGWSILMGLLFLIPSFYRSEIASKLYNATGHNFFEQARKLSFTQYEAALLLITFVSILANVVSYAEIFMYKYFVIDTPYFRTFVLSKLQILLHILACLAILSFSLKSNREKLYETA